MLKTYEAIPAMNRRSRFLQTTKIVNWLTAKLGFEVKAKDVVSLFEEAGYEFVFEKGGFHHWVKSKK